MRDLVAATTPTGAVVFTSRENAENSGYTIKRPVEALQPPKFPVNQGESEPATVADQANTQEA